MSFIKLDTIFTREPDESFFSWSSDSKDVAEPLIGLFGGGWFDDRRDDSFAFKQLLGIFTAQRL